MKAITYTIKHDVKALSNTIESILNDISSEHFMNDQLLFEIKVVLNELIVNAICHGNNCEQQKLSYVTFKFVNNDNLYISVKDEGCGKKQKPDLKSLDEYVKATNKSFCEHGRGLMIVGSLCDKVKYNRCGNKVSIIKNLSDVK